MWRARVGSLLLVVALAAGLVVAGCRERQEAKVEVPAKTPPPEVQVALPVEDEPAEEDEAIEVARELGTPTGNPVIATDSGLQYIDVETGEGEGAEAGNMVSVHYTGWLVDGTKFDSSKDRGTPFQFPLGAGRVIKGWDEGVAGMKVGGVRKLVIPPELGYGSRGAGSAIPPNATLIFEVELLEAG